MRSEQEELARVTDLLEKERSAGIPSIPAALEPKAINRLLMEQERRPLTGKQIRRASFGLASAFAAVFLVTAVFRGGDWLHNKTNGAGSIKEEIRMDMASDAAVSEGLFSGVTAGQSEEALRSDAGSGSLIRMPEGSYEASCLENDTLYLAQKTEEHILYSIPLDAPENWEMRRLEILPQERIMEISVRDGMLVICTDRENVLTVPLLSD